jgi:hypothetical protein
MASWKKAPFRYTLIGLEQGSAKKPYEVVITTDTRDGSQWVSCNCPAYRFSGEKRSCKHIERGGYHIEMPEIDFPGEAVPEKEAVRKAEGKWSYGDLMKPGGSCKADGPEMTSPEWVGEEKYDGISGYLAFDAEGRMSAFSPSRDVTHCLPEVVAPGLAMWVIQVEYLSGVPSTSSNVATLLSNGGWTTAKVPGLAILDVPVAGKDIQHVALSSRDHFRRVASAALLANVPSGFRVIVPTFIHGDKRERFAQIVANGGEGLVLKRLSSGYKADRQKDWLKIKAERFVDCVVRSYTDGKGKYEGTVGALVLELKRDDQWVIVGTTSGMTDAKRAFFKQALDEGRHFVVEAKFQNWTSGLRLRHPRFVRIRGDKRAEDCTWESQGPEADNARGHI